MSGDPALQPLRNGNNHVRDEHSYVQESQKLSPVLGRKKNLKDDDWAWKSCHYTNDSGEKVFVNYKEKVKEEENKFKKDPNPKVLTSEGFGRLKKVVEDRVPSLPMISLAPPAFPPPPPLKPPALNSVSLGEQLSGIPSKVPLMPKTMKWDPKEPEKIPTLTVDGSKSNTIVVMPANFKGPIPDGVNKVGGDIVKDLQIKELKGKLFQFMKANEKFTKNIADLNYRLKDEKAKNEKLAQLVPPFWLEYHLFGGEQNKYLPQAPMKRSLGAVKGLKWRKEVIDMASGLRNKIGLKHYGELLDKGLPLPSVRRLKAKTKKEEIRREALKRNFEELDREDPNRKKIKIRGPTPKVKPEASSRKDIPDTPNEVDKAKDGGIQEGSCSGVVKQEVIDFEETVIEQPPCSPEQVKVSTSLLNEALLPKAEDVQPPPTTSFQLSGISPRPSQPLGGQRSFKVQKQDLRRQRILHSKISSDLSPSTQFYMPKSS